MYIETIVTKKANPFAWAAIIPPGRVGSSKPVPVKMKISLEKRDDSVQPVVDYVAFSFSYRKSQSGQHTRYFFQGDYCERRGTISGYYLENGVPRGFFTAFRDHIPTRE